MSRERLPSVPVFKNTLGNYEIAVRMGNHRRKMEELSRKKQQQEKVHHTISYKGMLD